MLIALRILKGLVFVTLLVLCIRKDKTEETESQ